MFGWCLRGRKSRIQTIATSSAKVVLGRKREGTHEPPMISSVKHQYPQGVPTLSRSLFGLLARLIVGGFVADGGSVS